MINKIAGTPAYTQYVNRVVLDLSSGTQNEPLFSQDVDVDAIELNAKRRVFLDLVDYYSDSFIEYGYITWFAAAFPSGPFISMVINSVELRGKLYGLLYVFQRPPCLRGSGIGAWMDIWEVMSRILLYNNIVLKI